MHMLKLSGSVWDDLRDAERPASVPHCPAQQRPEATLPQTQTQTQTQTQAVFVERLNQKANTHIALVSHGAHEPGLASGFPESDSRNGTQHRHSCQERSGQAHGGGRWGRQ